MLVVGNGEVRIGDNKPVFSVYALDLDLTGVIG